MDTSDFISPITENAYEHIVPLPSEGGTSQSFLVVKEGRTFFMKKLRDEFVGDALHCLLFRKEFEIGSQLNHPHVVTYHHLHDSNNEKHMLVEFVEGVTIQQLCKENPDFFNDTKSLDRFMQQLLDGLNYLHNRRIVHCDIKPQNIMLTRVNHDVKILDLGFCYHSTYRTSAGRTWKFAAPEQKKTDGNIDVRTDIYAIGKLLEYLEQHSGHRLPPRYRRVMKRCTQDSPDARFANCEALRSALFEHRKRRKWLRSATIAFPILLFVSIFFWHAWDSFPMEVQIYWKSKYHFVRNNIQQLFVSDLLYDDLYYTITSDSTCTVSGCTYTTQARVRAKVEIDGKYYRTTSIAPFAFAGAGRLEAIHLPDGIQHIGREAFINCNGVVSLMMPNSIKEVDEEICSCMTQLKNVELSSQLKKTNKAMLVGCTQLEYIQIPEGVTHLGFDALAKCSNLKEVRLPKSLKVIERGAFWECTQLTRIDIPPHVESVGDYAFYHCDRLTDIYMHCPTPPRANTPIKHKQRVTIHVPHDCAEAYQQDIVFGKYHIVADIPNREEDMII